MASCKTKQWITDSPYVKLVVTESASTSTKATLTWELYYIADSAAQTAVDKAYTVTIDGTAVKSGSFDIDGKTGTKLIASGTKDITRTSSTKTVSFGVSFTFNLTWSGSYAGTLTASGSISVTAALPTFTACGVPTGLSLVDNGNNTATLSCKIGSNGTNNAASYVELFITCDGSTPSASNYTYTYTFDGTAGKTVTKTISFAALSSLTMKGWLGDTCTGNLKFTARTCGEGGSKYYSAVATAKSISFTWHGRALAPVIAVPFAKGETAGLLSGYRVSWTAGAGGINNAFSKYTIRVYDVTQAADVATYNTTNLYYLVPASILTAGHAYRFYIKTVGTVAGLDSSEAQSGLLTVKAITKFPAITATASAGNTVAAIEFFDDYDVYADIGTGTVVKLTWDTPIAANNEVDYYTLLISVYNPSNASYSTLFSDSIGNVNEYYLTSDFLSKVQFANYKLSITLIARSKYGAVYSSPTSSSTVYVSKACGTYLKVSDGYKQPVMKRTIAFAKLGYRVLKDEYGKAIAAKDGTPIYGKASTVQDTISGWTPMLDFYKKLDDGAWKPSDIRYEVLTDSNGEIITDSSNNAIYTL